MNVTSLKQEFSKYHLGQRVFYTGPTTYYRNVSNEPATIDVIGNCICLILDDSKPRYQDNEGIDVIPSPQRATLGIGDIRSGAKIIKPMR